MSSLLARQVHFGTPLRFSHLREYIVGDIAAPVGTGKSLLLKAIIAALKKKYVSKPELVSVTASTGMAASNIGGALRRVELRARFLNNLWQA